MSKTFKTRPLKVRIADVKDNHVSYVEVHNHTLGECDLPVTVKKQNKLTNKEYAQLTCFYSFKYTGRRICGCDMCTESSLRKYERRQTRHNKRSSIEEQL